MPTARRLTQSVLFILLLGAASCSPGSGSKPATEDPEAGDVGGDAGLDDPLSDLEGPTSDLGEHDAQRDGAADADFDAALDTDIAADTSPELGPDGPADLPMDDGVDAPPDAAPDLGLDATEDDALEDIVITDDGGSNECGFPPPAGGSRYNHLLALQDAALIAGLHDLIDDHNGLTYNEARDIMYVTADIEVDEDGNIEGIYTGWTAPEDGTRSPNGPNGEITTEHTWPRSDGAESFPAEGDLHHLAPAISEANGARGSFQFGDVACGGGGEPACDWADGGSYQGPSEGDGSDVFEVRPVSRGNVARAHFYFSVRYELPIGANEEAVLRRWHCEDPPDVRERTRNHDVETYQNNRNPFVDRPGLVFRIADF